MNGSPNDLMPLGRGGVCPSIHSQWDRHAPQDQTDLTKGQDDSSEAVEEASRNGAKTLTRGRRLAPWWGRPTPPGAWRPLAPGFFRCLPESSPIPFVIFFVVDKFRDYFTLESLFSAFLEFTLENTEYTKLMEIVSLNPRLMCFHVLLRV